MEMNVELVKADMPCNNSVKYQSVIGFGKASILESAQEKTEALNLLMNKYMGKAPPAYPEKALNSVCVIKIDIDSMTGKQSVWVFNT